MKSGTTSYLQILGVWGDWTDGRMEEEGPLILSWFTKEAAKSVGIARVQKSGPRSFHLLAPLATMASKHTNDYSVCSCDGSSWTITHFYSI